jgi:hypothetical protein
LHSEDRAVLCRTESSVRRFALMALVVLSGCVGMGREYGEKHPVGTVLPTTCVSVTSFAPELRSSPRSNAPDTYVGYFSYGSTWPGGPVFLVSPVTLEPGQPVGALLLAASTRKQKFWEEATLRSGRLAEGEVFEAIVPPKQHQPHPNDTIIERDAIMVRGSIHAACGKHYLVAVQANPFATESDEEWAAIRKNYDLFVANLQWPAAQ